MTKERTDASQRSGKWTMVMYFALCATIGAIVVGVIAAFCDASTLAIAIWAFLGAAGGLVLGFCGLLMLAGYTEDPG